MNPLSMWEYSIRSSGDLANPGTVRRANITAPFSKAERAKALALFKRMADVGKIYDPAKFMQETKKLYVFKPQPHRFFNFFTKGKRIIVVSAYQKQGQKAPAREIERG